MTSRLVVIPLILMTTAAIADSQRAPISGPADAQAHAAALLSPHTSRTSKDGQRHAPSVASPAMDAHASAAALLSGTRSAGTRNASAAVGQPSGARIYGDAQAQAAALFRGSHSSTDSQLQTQRTKSDDARVGRSAR
jgi:hypothetical protein